MPDKSQPHDVDLDRTDQLPIRQGTSSDDDVSDDAVRLDYSPVAKSVKSTFRRASPAALPSLDESVRSAEQRIARRNAEYEALTRSQEKARAAEAEAASRAASLASELAATRGLLETERTRSRELEEAVAAQSAAAKHAQTRMEEALREAERQLRETRALQETLAARDATIAQVLHSLGERDAQLSALQREHAQIVPSLEERSTAAVQLEADLRAARVRIESATADLDGARQAVAALTAQLKRGDEELRATRRDLNSVKAQAAAHLEQLRTREFRRALDQSSGVQVDHGALLSERDELRRRAADLAAQLATREEALGRLGSEAANEQALRAKRELKVQELERACADLTERLSAGSLDGQRGKDLLSAAEQSRADLALEVLRLRAEAQEREGQMEVLLVHLQEARRLMRQGNLEAKRAAAREPTRPDAAEAPSAPECAVDLIRIDGSHQESHSLSRRTRIGRAPGCELHIESSSVSRHHALVLTNSRDVIIEDLHSTNGVLVNGRKVTRQLLTDGDILTIGEAQFRLRVKPGPRGREATEPGAS